MNLLEIFGYSLGVFLAVSVAKSLYYRVRYAGRFTFSKHFSLLNAKDHGSICACLLGSIVNDKAMLQFGKESGFPSEVLAIREKLMEDKLSLFKKLQRSVAISDTFKVDLDAILKEGEAQLKVLMDHAKLHSVEVPKDKTKAN